MADAAPLLPPALGINSNTRANRNRRPRGGRAPNPSQQESEHVGQEAHRGGRGGSGGGNRGRLARESLLSMRPSSVPPTQHPTSVEPSSADVSANEQSGTRPPRARRARGGRVTANRTVNGRSFGGNLTQEGTEDDDIGQLQADAPTFVPGQQHVARNNTPQTNQQRARRRRASKSMAPDIATRTHEDIDNGHYECPICTSEVLRNSKVWSCRTCWTVFHLSCIKKWSTNEGSAAARQNMADGALPPPRQWRCPGCNLPKDTLPKTYTCWCEKETDPKSLAGLPPHSCGNTCGKERVKKCPHPCQLTCHAGPCPPCTHMGPTQSCFCGKHESTRRCVDTDYDSGWTCGEICGDIMPCGEHSCDRPCHEGLCGACEVRVDARCYCGQVEKAVLCSDRGDERTSQAKHLTDSGEAVEEEWVGAFECTHLCDRAFDCGIHHCKNSCHSQQMEPEHCPRSPDIVTHCPCRKTKLSELSSYSRQSCQDVIPNCKKPCMKPLSCGHLCEQLCHSGDCLPCLKTVQISCRCGRTSSSTICHQGTIEEPQCMRICRATLNCGRHACDERCCPGERKAAERQATKRKQRPIDSAPRSVDDLFEAEHICTRACDRPLKCGNHTCQELCHKGPCGSCPEAIFDEIRCDCGRTVLQPPLPCGTKPPPCRYQCERPKTCGHPQVQHTCHLGNESCPRCPFLIEKRCMCGKKTLKNQQCWLQDVRCGEICGKKLKCGSHFCRKPCHRAGDCEDDGARPCQQPCGKPKTICGHPDENLCHAPFPCKEEKPCTSKIFATCECQAQKQEMRCNASKSSEGNLLKSLACNEECARLERNRKLAVALNIDQALRTEGGDHVPYSNETLTLFQAHAKWAQTQEREFRVFADADDEKRLRFKPMPPNQRAFLHHLAEDFGLDSESMDPEPHRHVALFKSPRFVSAPNKTLAECVRIRIAQRAAAGTSGNTSDGEAQKKIKASNEVGEPFNSFVISNPRFGLTVEEVRAALATTITPSAPFQFDIAFLPSEEVLLKAINRTLTDHDLGQVLKDFKSPLSTVIAGKAIGTLQLCHTDTSLNVTRRESDMGSHDGWSRVAAKGAAPRRINQQTSLGGNNLFSALSGSKVTFAKKKEKQKPVKTENIVDDWEAAEMAEEEKERKINVDDGSGVDGTAAELESVLQQSQASTEPQPVVESSISDGGASMVQQMSIAEAPVSEQDAAMADALVSEQIASVLSESILDNTSSVEEVQEALLERANLAEADAKLT